MIGKTHIGDCRDTMRWLASLGMKVQTCITSPPYWGLRDYGHPGQLGLEQTPDEYVANMVEVFRLVRELLADDGTLWLNLGDSYNNFRSEMGPGQGVHGRNKLNGKPEIKTRRRSYAGLKEKDLIGIPWRVAFALQADGWYLRQDIIWHKPNPMPESVIDRCTKAHEYLFLLSKSSRYYFDAEAIKEPSVRPGGVQTFGGKKAREGTISAGDPRYRNGSEQWGRTVVASETRNRRSVWTVATQPFSGAHFATFPPALIEPCILAGSRSGDIVLDPFMGSGTTAAVAERLGRKWVGCEINENYADLQKGRIVQSWLEL